MNYRHLGKAGIQLSELSFGSWVTFHNQAGPSTPVEETVWAMHNIIERGKALYWGTSEWEAADIVSAIQIAERHHLHKPVVEQPVYNLFEQHRLGPDYKAVYEEHRLGSTTWSPSRLAKVSALEPLAADMGATLAQFSLAWCLQNPYVSTVLTGASRVEQVRENMKALNFVDRFTPEIMNEIQRIFCEAG